MTKLILLLFSMTLFACGQKGTSETTVPVTEVKKAPATTVPLFDADSAYAYVEKQVSFGYRVPNTPAHKACGDYLASELKRFGAQVYEQEATLTAYDGTPLESRNIIGSFNPDKDKRILLFAHWDTRPYSDHDPDPANHKKPLDGADDGASGVGALLEILKTGTTTRATPGASAVASGGRTRTNRATKPNSVFYSTWSAPKMRSSIKNIFR